MTTVNQVALPKAARNLGTLGRLDYHDSFVATTPLARELTAEEWAREMLEGAPAATRSALSSGWLSLGLKRGSGDSEELVLGWEMRRSGPDYALLARDSRVGMPAELLIRTQDDGLFFATFIRHSNLAARLAWGRIAGPHRMVVRKLLEQAVRRAEAAAAG